MERKTLAIGIVVIVAIAAGTTGAVLFFVQPIPGAGEVVLIAATMYGPVDLDPIWSWDSASNDVIDQVVEPLYAYDLGDPSLAQIPRLAADDGSWNPGADQFTVALRQGVKFHDGTDFNADAVIAHWDRMAWALNTTGTNTVDITQVAELYEFADGTPIVYNVIKNSDYSVTFNLSSPFVPFKALLSFAGSYILSPTFTATLTNQYIDTATGDLIGTGPFVYDGYEVGVEVNFHAFDDYWNGRSALDRIVLSEITDANARNLALLSGDINLLLDPMDELLGIFELAEGITVEEGPQGTVTQYLGMNNNLINVTLREAISYSLDYDYILDELRLGNAVRMKSPIPEGIMYANTTFKVPIYNISYARELMQDMGYGGALNTTFPGTDDDLWAAATFKTFKYTYNIGNSFRENMLVLLTDNLKNIGVKVEDDGMTWGEFLSRLYEWGNDTRDMLNLYFVGWGPDYNDPSNFINPLFTNRSVAANGAQYNGWLSSENSSVLNDNVQLLMEEAIIETDATTREGYYDRIQELLITRDYPWAWCYVGRSFRCYVDNMVGYDLNPMGNEWWYPISFT